MRLDRIEVENFRCFEKLTLDIHPELTVLIAPNGAGKTTLLDAARIALWPFVKAFDLGSQTGKSATIQIEDVRLALHSNENMEPQIPAKVTATGKWLGDAEVKSWTQTRERIKAGTNTLGDNATKELTRRGARLQSEIRAENNGAAVALPLISYLGTSRLWYQGRYTSVAAETTLDKSIYSRTSGYLNCLTYASSFKQFSEWYGWIYRSYREAQLIAMEKGTQIDEHGKYFENVIHVIKQAINALIFEQTGWHDIEYSARHQQQLVLHHLSHGVLPIEMLSDGLRNTVSMVADLAFRAYKLNPHLGINAARETSGVALIDEVDMFLHPSWQQTVLSGLRHAFPRIQFIVTTHSPQVLSTVHRENIRVIGLNRQGQMGAEPPLAMTYGEPSGDVMHSVMLVDPQPPVLEKQDLQRLTELVDQGAYDRADAQKLMHELIAKFGEQHPQLQRLQRSIRRQQALQR
jgi:predicted ATP-binding protein involved in virulence